MKKRRNVLLELAVWLSRWNLCARNRGRTVVATVTEMGQIKQREDGQVLLRGRCFLLVSEHASPLPQTSPPLRSLLWPWQALTGFCYHAELYLLTCPFGPANRGLLRAGTASYLSVPTAPRMVLTHVCSRDVCELDE